MAKTVVSAFQTEAAAAQVLNSMISGGYDPHHFSLIGPAPPGKLREHAFLETVPGLQARVYRRDLQEGKSLFVARVSEKDVARLIKLLQSTGGRHIEAFDLVGT